MDDTGAPKLDPRSHDDVIAQTEALATAYTSDVDGGPWRRRSDGTLDFGGALIRLFGGMVDHLIAQLNQVPDKQRRAFSGLVGARRVPPRPARAPVTFTLAAGSGVGEVPASAQVAATGPEGPVVFETEAALPLTRARLAAVFVRDVADTGGYANQTAIATGQAPGAFAALGGGQPIEHQLFVAAEDLLAVPGAQTLVVVLDGGGVALPATAVTWEARGPSGWAALPPVAVAGGKWTLSAPASQIGAVTVNGVKARWLRATVPAGSPAMAVTTALAFTVTHKSQIDPTAPATLPVPLDAALANGQPLDFTRDILPFGDRPRFNDTFYLASDAGFAVGGATVTLTFTLTPPPLGVNASSDLKLQWEIWNGQTATVLGTTTSAGTTTGGLTDGTKAFTQAGGAVSFALATAIPRATIGGVTSRWVRVRIIAGNYGHDLIATTDDTVTPPRIVITQADFRPPSVSSVALAWTGTSPAQPPTAVVRRTALSYK
ncbi:MAG TPA: hypothetical protein VK601_22955, partial [Kofleriaceae bacterium]|nr:hypothetical protein [Kofleriaceae bacterium]